MIQRGALSESGRAMGCHCAAPFFERSSGTESRIRDEFEGSPLIPERIGAKISKRAPFRRLNLLKQREGRSIGCPNLCPYYRVHRF